MMRKEKGGWKVINKIGVILLKTKAQQSFGIKGSLIL